MSASLFRNFTTLLLWEAWNLNPRLEGSCTGACFFCSFWDLRSRGRTTWANRGWILHGLDWERLFFFGTMKFNSQKKNIVLLTAKHGCFSTTGSERKWSLSFSLYIYMYTIYYNMFGPWLWIVLFVNIFGALLASLGRIFWSCQLKRVTPDEHEDSYWRCKLLRGWV